MLFAYAFASNVAISVVPHEPAVIAAGAQLGIACAAIVATLGTLLAGFADYTLFAKRLAGRVQPGKGLAGYLVQRFAAAPFVILVAASLTPLPYWPFKALALASGYPMSRYLAALGLGRLARYALLAWLGNVLAIPTWTVVAISLALTAAVFMMRPAKKEETMENLNDSDKAQRTTQSFTAAWEKRNLPKMARALPSWVTPDHLTGLGVFAAALIGAGYVLAHLSPWWLMLCVVGLVVHWAGDSLDGTLARVRKMERERYGYYVDRTADAISTVLIGIGFGLSPYVHLSVAMMMTIGYLLLQLYAEICAYTSRRFPLSFGYMGPTEARIALGAFTTALMFWTPRSFMFGPFNLTYVDAVVLATSAGLIFTFMKSSLQEAKYLDKLDRAAWSPQVLTSSGFTVAIDSSDEN